MTLSRADRIALVMGTRPEVIKLAPLVRALERRPEFEPLVCAVQQQRESLDRALEEWGLEPAVRVPVPTPFENGYLERAGRLAQTGIVTVLRDLRPEWVVVQGDTLTTFSAARAAHRIGLPIVHVEAGLRSGDELDPYPEELFRRRVTALASIHYPPTEGAAENLRAEGIHDEDLLVVGNTGIDSLSARLERDLPMRGSGNGHPNDGRGERLLVTLHRRENHGDELEPICEALLALLDVRPELSIEFIRHPNPRAYAHAQKRLGSHRRVRFRDPLDHATFLDLLRRVDLVLSDSGGVQEEAPYLEKPVLIARDRTERPESLSMEMARVVGRDHERILAGALHYLDRAERGVPWPSTNGSSSPFGNGRAAERIAADLADRRALPGSGAPLREVRAGLDRWLETAPLNADGAALSWVNPRHPGYVYPEATALLLTYFARQERGSRARAGLAEALVRMTSDTGGVGRGGVSYLFDTALAAAALKIDAEERRIPAPCAVALQHDFVLDCLSRRSPCRPKSPLRWSSAFGPHLIKTLGVLVRNGLLKLDHAATYLPELCECFDGRRFREHPASGRTYAHAHAYALEGLLLLSSAGLDSHDDVIAEGARWLAEVRESDGTILPHHENAARSGAPRLDVTAQAARIWMCVDAEEYAEAILAALAALARAQRPSGGLPYEPGSEDENTWVGVFAAQALTWYASGEARPSDLI